MQSLAPGLDLTLPPSSGNVFVDIGRGGAFHRTGLACVFGNLFEVVIVSCGVFTVLDHSCALFDALCVLWIVCWIE